MDEENPHLRRGLAEARQMVLYLQRLIHSRGRSQSWVETQLGWSQGYVSQIFRGRLPLKIPFLLAILDVLEVDPMDFFQSFYDDPEILPERARAADAENLAMVRNLEALLREQVAIARGVPDGDGDGDEGDVLHHGDAFDAAVERVVLRVLKRVVADAS